MNDEWETPHWLFNLITKHMRVVIDACANPQTAKVRHFFDDATQSWANQIVNMLEFPDTAMREQSIFMHPPCSRKLIGPCIDQALKASTYTRVICLVRDDASMRWYNKIAHENAKTWYPCNREELDTDLSFIAKEKGVHIIRLPERLKFESNGVPQRTSPIPYCLIILDRRS